MHTMKDNAFLLESDPVKKSRNVWFNSVLDAGENGLPAILAVEPKVREMLCDQSWNDGFLTAVEWIYGNMFGPDTRAEKTKLMDELTAHFTKEKTPWVRLETLCELANRVPTPLLKELMSRLRIDLNGGAPCPPR